MVQLTIGCFHCTCHGNDDVDDADDNGDDDDGGDDDEEMTMEQIAYTIHWPSSKLFAGRDVTESNQNALGILLCAYRDDDEEYDERDVPESYLQNDRKPFPNYFIPYFQSKQSAILN